MVLLKCAVLFALTGILGHREVTVPMQLIDGPNLFSSLELMAKYKCVFNVTEFLEPREMSLTVIYDDTTPRITATREEAFRDFEGTKFENTESFVPGQTVEFKFVSVYQRVGDQEIPQSFPTGVCYATKDGFEPPQ